MTSPAKSKTLLQAGVIGIIALIPYVLTMPQFITLEDAGLFQMVCHVGGLSHPPGYPLFTLLCQQMSLFDSVFNGNMISIIFAVGAVVMFFLVVQRLTDDSILASIAALAYGYSATFWSQAIIIEVYSLAALMFMACWFVAILYLKTIEVRYWYLLCFFVGLALCNHWPLMILSSPALLVTLLPRWENLLSLVKTPSFWLISVLCFCAGLSPYLSLFSADPEVAVYGGINSLDEFLRYVSRSAYSDNHVVADSSHKLAYFYWLAVESMYQLGLLGLPLMLTGFVHSFRTRDWYENVSVVLIFLGSTFLLLALLNFEFSPFYQAIFRPYPVIAYAAISLWFAHGAKLLVTVLINAAQDSQLPKGITEEQAGKFVFLIVGFAAVVSVYLSNHESVDRSRSDFIDTYARTVLNTLPANAVLFTYGDNQTGPIGYLSMVEDVRPDIEVRDWANLVFSNRLSSPFIPTDAQQKVLEEFINTSVRPVFSIEARLSPSTNLGLYHKFNAAGGVEYAFDPDITDYLDTLLQLYIDDDLTDGHEQHFLFNQLIGFSKQYVGFAALNPVSELTEDFLLRLKLLQSTFPGKLVTLEALFKQYHPVDTDSETKRKVLIDLAVKAEAEIPDYASLQSLAVFYELVARVHGLSVEGVELSIEYYHRSITAWPVGENTSICPLAQIYLDGPNKKAYDTLLQRFPDSRCEQDAGTKDST